MELLYYFIQSIPEAMGIIALSLAIARIPLRFNIIFAGGAGLSVKAFFIRQLPVAFGLHLPVCIFLIFF